MAKTCPACQETRDFYGLVTEPGAPVLVLSRDGSQLVCSNNICSYTEPVAIDTMAKILDAPVLPGFE